MTDIIMKQKFHTTPNRIPLTAPKTRNTFFKTMAKHLIMQQKNPRALESLEQVPSSTLSSNAMSLAGCRAWQLHACLGKWDHIKNLHLTPKQTLSPVLRLEGKLQIQPN